MTEGVQAMKNLREKLIVPNGKIDVVLDTDTYNEIDDQFALAYMMKSEEKLNVKAIYAAPFFNSKSNGPEDGMERSYQEILKLLSLMKREDMVANVKKGSRTYLKNEKEPVISPAAEDLVRRAMTYTEEAPLYVAAIGAITNIASALLLEPEIKNRIVLVWLGGNAPECPDTREFNMMQDIAAARVVFGCGVPLVQLPCAGVVSAFYTGAPELEFWLRGKNALCDYLVDNTVSTAEAYAKGKVWSRVIWDVTAVGWLLNDDDRFMTSILEPAPIPEYDDHYGYDSRRQLYRRVTGIHRDALFGDLFAKLAK